MLRMQRARRMFGLALAATCAWVTVQAMQEQGMGGPRRPVRPAQKIETDLPATTVDFKDLAEQAGLTAANASGSADHKQYILEATGNGVAIFDYDNDGLPDLFFANSSAPPHLYHNRGQLKFEDVTARAGIAETPADKNW